MKQNIKQEYLDKIKTIQRQYEADGFIIVGIFGSVARGDAKEESDIDILYRSTEIAELKYPGWKFFNLYDKVKTDLEKAFGKKVDLADMDALNKIGKKYILPEVVYVYPSTRTLGSCCSG